MPPPSRLLALRLSVGLVPLGAPTALAAPPGGAAEPSGGTPAEHDGRGAGGRAATEAEPRPSSRRSDRPWIQRWAPERNVLELGVYGGLWVPARDLELFEPRLEFPDQGFLPLAPLAPAVGARAGYYPLRFLGLEAEGGVMPSSVPEYDVDVTVWTLRGHVIGQLPVASIAPFVVAGAGALGVRGHPLVLGNDVDPAFHLGIGTKVFINRRITARLDLRDVISPRRGLGGDGTNSLEALLGLSIMLGRGPDREPEPAEPTPAPEASDADGDGFPDPDDRCPRAPGVAPDGCPAPADRDGDGWLDPDDACPDEPGAEPDGCPARDADHDGILVPDDACPDEPETLNGFEDDDGCPDELPEAVERFRGRLDGIHFELSKATLTPASRPALDQAVEVLQQFPSVRIEISGHTDNTGRREINMQLSQRRADAVKAYLVEHGVDEARITTRGAAPDEPIDSNVSREGRANNRRIEFRVLE
ncbi:MAG: OmpA family protein [Myxococcales bacterium]|nr:OmpA family protein [Myxococcales bacterium]